MADKNEIAFGLEVKGVEQSIKSVKDLKGAIKALQDEAEDADIGSEQYKNAIENIEKLNDKLKEVTQTEKQSAQAMEDMANAQKEAAKETGDLRKQFEVLEDELFMLAGQGKQNTKEFRDLANEAAALNKRIELVNQSLEGGAAIKSAEGYQMLSGSFTSLKEGILELDFGKIKDGLQQAKQGFVMFGQGAKTALQGVKGALLATGIGAFVVILGTIIAYWDDIKGAIDGVTSEQKKLNAAAAENLATEQDKLKSLESSDNTLKLQGKSEKEILELKIKQLDAVYEAQEAQLLTTLQTQEAQRAAEKRNKDILSGLLEFTMKPIEVLYKAIDAVGNALGKNFGLAQSINKANQEALVGENAEKEAARKKELDATIQQLKDLKEKRAGYQLGINKIDDDAAKAAAEKRTKALADHKAHLDALQAQEADAWFAQQVAEEERKAKEKKDQEQKELDEQARLEKLAADQDAQMARYTANKNAEAEIDKKKREEEKALELAKQNEILNFAQMSTQSHQALSDAFFAVKNRNLQKGSAAERKSAEQQFKVNKALAIQSAVITGIQGVMNALSAQSVLPEPIATVLRVATAVGVGIAAAANIAKIASTKFDAGGGGGGGGAAALPSAPPIPSPPSISTQQNNTSQSTSFDETGKRIGGDSEKQMTPVIQVKATVGVDEVSSKTNRVETLEKQSTF